ncbi:hypothetical protein L6164_023917 [Bauhinia variegata]|uniref:Uncharacterized protein n=1 Tax=Bauhinia variegata TaxID=167791 RepID=A0ACB9MJN6_BAUVA|nr:hypothetical protein L6164_023917 [Bauhinia variegata]
MEAEPCFASPSMWLTSSKWRWWSSETVAVVTGGNRGIGFAIVKRLAQLGLTVILTARDTQKGEAALNTLRDQYGLNVHFLPLDVSDPSSINTFASSFKARYGPTLDILVNNAGVSFNDLHNNSVEHAETVIKTNFYGPKLLTQALLPVFRALNTDSSQSSPTRILNISSRLGSLKKMRNSEIREVLESENVSEEEIDETVNMFLEDVKMGRWKNRGWPEYWTDYAVSKLALNAYSKVLGKRYDQLKREEDHQHGLLRVICFCPGFTQTSMTQGKGTHSADDAATFAAALVLLPPQYLPTTVKFFYLPSITSKL